MDYEVIEADNREEFVEKVKAALADGWQLQGGVALERVFAEWENERKGYQEREIFTKYAQAVVKPNDARPA